MSSDQGQYVGRFLSLVSKMKIRYEGRLASVNREEAALALSQVRSFGTENRVPEHRRVDPLDDVFDIIVFRANDIEELTVLDENSTPYIDPAVVSILGRRESVPQRVQSSHSVQRPFIPAPVLSKAPTPMSELHSMMEPPARYGSMPPPQQMPPSIPFLNSGSRLNSEWRHNPLPSHNQAPPRLPSFDGYRRPYEPMPRFVPEEGRRAITRNEDKENKAEYNTDYDFESNNARLKDVLTRIKKQAEENKEPVNEETEEKSEGTDRNDLEMSKTILGEIEPDHSKFYDKQRSFFDQISTDVHQFPPVRTAVPPRLRNTETFGRAAVQHQFNLYMQRMQMQQYRNQQYMMRGQVPPFNRYIPNNPRYMGGAARFPPPPHHLEAGSPPMQQPAMPSARFHMTNGHF